MALFFCFSFHWLLTKSIYTNSNIKTVLTTLCFLTLTQVNLTKTLSASLFDFGSLYELVLVLPEFKVFAFTNTFTSRVCISTLQPANRDCDLNHRASLQENNPVHATTMRHKPQRNKQTTSVKRNTKGGEKENKLVLKCLQTTSVAVFGLHE